MSLTSFFQTIKTYPKKRLVIISASIVAIVLAIVLTLITFARPTITITTYPDQADITIDDQTYVSPASIRISPGTYQIHVNKTGFFPETTTITATTSQAITITLSPLPKPHIDKAAPINSFTQPIPITANTFITLDQSTQKLTVYDPVSRTTEPLLPHPPSTVGNFSVSNDGNKIIIQTPAFPSPTPPQYYLVDTITNTLASLNLSTYSPIASFSFSPDGTRLAFLGSYDSHTNSTSFYLTNLSTLDTEQLKSNIEATELLWLNNTTLIFINPIDAPNQNTAQLYNLLNNTLAPLVTTPNFINHPTPHPSGKYLIYVDTNGVVMTDLDKKTTSPIHLMPPDTNLLWIDQDNFLAYSSSINGSFSITKINPFTKTVSGPAIINLQTNHQFISLMKTPTLIYALVFNTLTKTHELVPLQL